MVDNKEYKIEEVHICPVCKVEMRFYLRTHNHYVFRCDKCNRMHYE